MATNGAFVGILREYGGRRQILLLERTDGKGWNLPGGGADEHETWIECAERETWEETGLIVEVVEQVGDNHILRNVEGEVIDVACAYAVIAVGGELRDTAESKRQGWFALEDLDTIPIVGPQPPRKGRMRTMIEDLLNAGFPVQ